MGISCAVFFDVLKRSFVLVGLFFFAFFTSLACKLALAGDEVKIVAVSQRLVLFLFGMDGSCKRCSRLLAGGAVGGSPREGVAKTKLS